MAFPTPPAVDNRFVTESGRVMYDIYRRTVFTSPWLALPKKVAFPTEMGQEISTIAWERVWVDPSSEVDWNAVTLSPAPSSSQNPLPPKDEVEFYEVLRKFGLFHKAFESPDFNVNDLRYTGAASSQMQNVVKSLSDQARIYWIKFIRSQWGERAAYKYTFDGTSPTTLGESAEIGYGGTAAIADFPEPVSYLSNSLLEHIYNNLILDGASSTPLTRANGRPIFGLITDQVSSRRLIMDSDIREDWRQSSQSDKLLAALGVSTTYNGYVHMMDDMPPRWYVDGSGNWIQIPYYFKATRTVSGVADQVEIIVNPLYTIGIEPNADGTPSTDSAKKHTIYQDSFIYVPGSIQLRVPSSITSVGPAKFNPQNYMGDYKLMNILDRDDNPDGTLAFFRGILMAGGETVNPYHAVVIRHLVPSTDIQTLT